MGFFDIFKSSSTGNSTPTNKADIQYSADRNGAIQQGMLALTSGDTKRAREIFMGLAEQGNAEAQCRLAFLFKVADHDYQKAAYWYRKAADQGYAEAQCKLGFLYRSGQGVPKNDVEGARYYQKAAEQGYAEAQYNCARCYLEGAGVTRNPHVAVEWLTKAADAGFDAAEYMLGVLYFEGRDVTLDGKKAIYWLNRAADRAGRSTPTMGDLFAPTEDNRNSGLNALYNLGQIYRTGKIVRQDSTRAFRYYLRAAELGDADSQFAVGVCYLNGDGIARDVRLGIEYLRKAALQGSQQALQALSQLQNT